MASDAHAHPYDLLKLNPDAEEERQRLGIACAASAWSKNEFSCHEQLASEARAKGGAVLYLGFAVHPQLPTKQPGSIQSSIQTLQELLSAKKLDVVGELGFDLYDETYKNTEKEQEELFRIQLLWAIECALPLVLHVRKAMHKVFAYTSLLKRCPAVLFHSYSGTMGEAQSLLRRGVNAYFSFGTVLLLNHKKVMNVCAQLPANRLVFETDAPYQPLLAMPYSSWKDLSSVITAAAHIRLSAGSSIAEVNELENISDMNFKHVYKR